MSPIHTYKTVTTYTFREIPCPTCKGHGRVTDWDYRARLCEDCEGDCEIGAACAECEKCLPLNDDGVCNRCADSLTLPVGEFDEKYGFLGLTAQSLRDPMGRRG